MMTTIAPRENLDKKISKLHDQILVLGNMVEQATLDAVKALKNRDLEAAKRVYAFDKQINKKCFKIEKACVALMATQQPVASDLRILASILEIATELERMGDYAKGIARICIKMDCQFPVKPITDLPRMAELATGMLHRALGAFVDADVDQATAIPKEDDQVDNLYNKINRALITYIFSDPSIIDRANLLIWAAHNLERMADRVTNICERTIYVATGKRKELDISDDEQERILLS